MKLETLFDRHAPPAWRLAVSLMGNAADADDVLQAAFVVAARKPAQVPAEDDAARGWLCQTVLNEARNARRKRARRAWEPLPMDCFDHHAPGPAAGAAERELGARALAALAELPKEEHEAIALTQLAGLSQREAAAAAGVAASTLNGRLQSGLERMRRRVSDPAAAIGVLGAVLAVAAPRDGWAAIRDRTLESATAASATTAGGGWIGWTARLGAVAGVVAFVVWLAQLAGTEPAAGGLASGPADAGAVASGDGEPAPLPATHTPRSGPAGVAAPASVAPAGTPAPPADGRPATLTAPPPLLRSFGGAVPWSSPVAAWSLAVHPGGTRIACGDAAGGIQIVDLATGNLIERWTGHRGAVVSLDYDPAGTRLVSAGRGGQVRLWDTESGRCLQVWKDVHESTEHVVFFDGGRRVAGASISDGEALALWTVAHPAALDRVEIGETDVLGLAAHEGALFVAVRDRGVFRVAGGALERVPAIVRNIWAFALSRGGDRLAAAADGRGLRLHDPETGAIAAVVREEASERADGDGATDQIYSVGFAADGRRLVAADDGARLLVFTPGSEGAPRVIATHHDPGVTLAMATHPSRPVAITASGDGTMAMWDLDTGRKLSRDPDDARHGHTKGVNAVAFAPAGDRLASGSDDGTAKVWDTASGRLLATCRPARGAVRGLAWTPDGTQLATAGNGLLTLFDTATGAEVRRIDDPEAIAGAVAINADGTKIAAGNVVWSLRTGAELARLPGVTRPRARAVAFSPQGDHLLVGRGNGHLWDCAAGVVRWSLKEHALSWDAQFDRRGVLFARGGTFGQTVVGDAATGKVLAQLENARHQPDYDVCFSNDSRLLLCAGPHVVRVYDWKEQRLVREFKAHAGNVAAIDIHPNGSSFVTAGSDDRQIRLWRVADR